jgi:NADPH-dependent 2,4-dienoyl-CoA reductase/sulfur reductase-like enzyme
VVRCPWHHACFDYKTGEARKAPALNPLPVWRTDVQNGIVYVREKKPAAAAHGAPFSDRRFVIVGSGAAGHAAAEMLRRKGFAGSLLVLSEDSALPYDRPNLSKDYLAGNAPEEWMPLRSAEFYQNEKIEIRLNSKVTELDAENKILRLASGDLVRFDKCLLATGGTPVRPAIEGLNLPHVHVLRSMADCQSILKDLAGAAKIVIAGAGFIGLEAAAAFRARGLDVTVVAPNQGPLAHVLGEEMSSFVRSVHESQGVTFKFERALVRIEKKSVRLSDGSSLEADLVLVATGITPNTALAEKADLNCGDGILVNRHLETSARDIYAAGDATLYPDVHTGKLQRVEHWVVAQRQGQVAALNMLGENHVYSEIPFFWSQQFDLSLSYVGVSKKWDRIEIFGNPKGRDGAVAYFENGRIAAVLTIGRDQLSLRLECAFERNDQAEIQRLLNVSLKH